ncbi:MAG: alpha/beta hydrolase [Bacteroidales bacterium]|nr:alpha/beta hydrolase [Bacteroidales bacterium]
MINIFQKGGRIMSVVLTIILVMIVLMAGTLFYFSPGKAIPILNNEGRPVPGSLSEKVFVEINGTKQGMFIKSRKADNPVLLYLHGGMPDYFLTDKYPTGLEELFTMVWWEQRGSGMSYDSDLPEGSATLEQMVADTRALTDYLRRRFNQEKIYLMGHSGGTFIGILTAAEYPELYHAYIGVAQMSDQLKSEVLAYNYMLQEYRRMGDMGMVKKLEAAPVSLEKGIPENYPPLRDPAMHALGIGTTRDMKSVITGIFLPSLKCREYTLREKFNLWMGKSKSGISILWREMVATDLSVRVPELQIPVYFMEGKYDYTCSYTEAKSYFIKLKAPMKGFYTFDRSAHSPLFEEPEKFRQIIQQDVFRKENKLSDFYIGDN